MKNQKINLKNTLFLIMLSLPVALFYTNCMGFHVGAPGTSASASSGNSPSSTPTSGTPTDVTPVNGYIFDGAYDKFVGPVFDYSKIIQTNQPIPQVYGGDEGKYRFSCYASHELYDDPIVYPGQPGASHLHEFFGNRKANAKSTYESLRNSGDSSCGANLNRSAYWMPALLNGDETLVIRPDTIIVYYAGKMTNAAACKIGAKDCKPFPKGLRFVYGFNFTTGDHGIARWSCVHKDGTAATPAMDIISISKNCLPGDQLEATLDGQPNCWDGVHLDTPDHRSHLAYGDYSDGSGIYKCPATHPYFVPSYTIKAFYTVDNSFDSTGTYTAGVTKTWHLSSDMMGKTKIPGETLHADWFGAWDEQTMDRVMKGCIGLGRGGNNGDLCDGDRVPDALGTQAPPRMVPLPGMPAASSAMMHMHH